MSRFSKYGFVDRNNPEAAAMCDMGGEIRKRSELHKQMAWAGGKLVWNGLLACAKHRDIPNPQDRLQVLRADPVPVENPRPDLDAAHIRNTTVYPDGAAITYPNGQWIENALNEDVYRGLHLGGMDTTPPVIPPVLDDPTDFHAPLDVFVLGFNVLAPGDVVTPPGGGTDTEGLTSPDGQILLGPIDGQVLLPPT